MEVATVGVRQHTHAQTGATQAAECREGLPVRDRLSVRFLPLPGVCVAAARQPVGGTAGRELRKACRAFAMSSTDASDPSVRAIATKSVGGGSTRVK